MKVVKHSTAGIVRRVILIDDSGEDIVPVSRFLSHLADSGYSPNTLCAYAYDLRRLFMLCDERGMAWTDFHPSTALELSGYLRQIPSRGPAQRLGLAVANEEGRRLSAATVARILVATSSFYEWAIAAELYIGAENPLQKRDDPALAKVLDRHLPFVGDASRQRPIRRVVRVRLPIRLPRPLSKKDIDALMASMTSQRDLAIFLLMLDGGMRPGEVLCLRLTDISYGHRRVTIRKRDDHPRGARAKSRRERVVDLHEARTLDAVSRYILHERSPDASSDFVFLVDGTGVRQCEPLSYQAVVRGFGGWNGWVSDRQRRPHMRCGTHTRQRCGNRE